MTNPVVHTQIRKVAAASASDINDVLATEDPLEIKLLYGPVHNRRQQSLSVTMRTPGHDPELVKGFLFSEGIIRQHDDIKDIALADKAEGSVATVALKESVAPDLQHSNRNFTATAACGVCGKTDIANIHTGVNVSKGEAFVIPSSLIYQLPETLRSQQDVFDATGGLHAAALFDRNGNLLILREDIGRHNAVDKLIGAALTQRLIPLHTHLMLLSGRAGFELIQKAAMAGISLIAAVGAPSSLAVKMADTWNITLIGFLREQRFNIYTKPERIEIR
ncbi:MAG TPA: formate dehydrogenase accessory sulfurtransferase FdhD [Chitinophaga sp.]|uniref:formate dehydrogenase accessory sulfurtransferase FdhD n=1 Tax=Chitinophaga sp. TaxID=1869181 RepID=UPI002C65C2E5|nr:formate dehydrogenase accessory sulfurtransferase FdhD [Chitinophaga sp.]HVI43231.1 formate dehydrogenase accessory sulfurtransferase FdhD [Chitinophaga sp.]